MSGVWLTGMEKLSCYVETGARTHSMQRFQYEVIHSKLFHANEIDVIDLTCKMVCPKILTS